MQIGIAWNFFPLPLVFVFSINDFYSSSHLNIFPYYLSHTSPFVFAMFVNLPPLTPQTFSHKGWCKRNHTNKWSTENSHWQSNSVVCWRKKTKTKLNNSYSLQNIDDLIEVNNDRKTWWSISIMIKPWELFI